MLRPDIQALLEHNSQEKKHVCRTRVFRIRPSLIYSSAKPERLALTDTSAAETKHRRLFRDFLEERFLLRELVGRDIQTRYIGSLVGFFWSVLNPLVQLTLYTVIFSVVLKQRFDDSDSTGRFALYLFAALLPWMALQEAVTRSSRTFIENANLIKKVRFPLRILPLGLAVSAFIHQCIGTLILVIVLATTGALHYTTLPFLILLFFFELMLLYGLSLTVACLNVFFRDISQLLGVFFMLFFWLTPIVYPMSRAPGGFRWLLTVNPLTHMVEAFRFVLLGSPPPSLPGVVYWTLFCLASLLLGKFILRRTTLDIVDLV